MKKEVQHLIKKASVTKKLNITLCLWMLAGSSMPLFQNSAFAETESSSQAENASLSTIQSNVVENELPNYNQSAGIKEEKPTSTTEKSEESTSFVPANSEPDRTTEEPEKKTRGLTRAAADKITIVDTGIVLTNDGKYLLMDNPEDYVSNIYNPATDVKEEGEYDADTIIEIANIKEYGLNRLYSERNPSGNNKIQQIRVADGTFSELTILSDSALDIQTDLDYGINVTKLIIGEFEELVWNPVDLKVRSANIGIYTRNGTRNVTGNVDTAASQAGISITKEQPPARENYTEMVAFYKKLELEDSYGAYEAESGTRILAEGTSSTGSGAIFYNYELKGSELIAKAGDKGYGIFSGEMGIVARSVADSHGQEEEQFFEAQLSGTSSSGIGLFADGVISNYGGKISGVSNTSNGIEAHMYDSHNVSYNVNHYPSELSGSTNAGFGILMRYVSEYNGSLETTPGGMELTSGKVEGQSADGTGIFSGQISVNENSQEINISGAAASGQGIVTGAMFVYSYQQPKPKVSISGTSTGESDRTLTTILGLLNSEGTEPIDKTPVSAGIVAVGGIQDEGHDIYLRGTAPIDIDGSYGIYTLDGVESGIHIKGEKNAVIEAEGDYGIYSSIFNVSLEHPLTDIEGLLTMNVDARSVGVKTEREFSVSSSLEAGTNQDSRIDIKASEGNGVDSPAGIKLSFMQYSGAGIYKVPVNITAGNTAVNTAFDIGSSYYPNGIEIEGIELTILGANVGINGKNHTNYSFRNSSLSISTVNNGMVLEALEGEGYITFSGVSAKIDSGEYGLKIKALETYFDSSSSPGETRIDVTAEQYPIWLVSNVEVRNSEKYDETTWDSYYEDFLIIATSKSIQPDKENHPSFYVQDHAINIDGYPEKIKIIENYEAPVLTPFNATPSTPYSIVNNFNVEEYGNYNWEALRTDTNAPVVINTSQIAQNKLFTEDQEYEEAKLTAKRTSHLADERIFTDVANVQNADQILHEINMIVRREQQYRVTYEPNGADGGNVPIDATLYTQGESVNVAPQGNLSKTDHRFIGWLNSVDHQIYQNPFLPSSPATYTMGQSDVVFTAQWQSDSVVEELELLTSQIPDNIKFGSHEIQHGADKVYYATNSGDDTENASATDLTTGIIGVKDTRLSTEGWRLTIQQKEQFKTTNNQLLAGTQLVLDVGIPDVSQITSGSPTGVSNQEVALTPGQSQELLRATNGQGKGIVELPIRKFVLKVPGATKKYTSEYTTQIEWLVSNVP
ncbi:WxL domain-containing protein [Enterococcus sp. AZ109]|uniref:WxL domain-containing protein n=1 Tax=Enterococcus sp. AZ109 TaxID=2774634 RepID=UPI003F23A10C